MNLPRPKLPKLGRGRAGAGASKGSQVKVPDFAADIYWDLRERRLLPLVGLVVVAILAVPFLLGEPEENEVPPLTTGALDAEANAEGAQLTVVEARPGLRDYRKRLKRKPTDPFEQRYTAPVLKGAKLNEARPGESLPPPLPGGGGGGQGGAAIEKEGGTTPGGGGSKGSDPPAKQEAFVWAVDVRVVRSGGSTPEALAKSEASEPIVKRKVIEQSPVPGINLPVVTFLGPSREAQGNRPLFMVSSRVTAVFGEARCISGAEVCQLLELEPELPVTFVYGPSGVHYTLTVTKYGPVPARSVTQPAPQGGGENGVEPGQMQQRAAWQNFSK